LWFREMKSQVKAPQPDRSRVQRRPATAAPPRRPAKRPAPARRSSPASQRRRLIDSRRAPGLSAFSTGPT
jgi:hypothetical protein